MVDFCHNYDGVDFTTSAVILGPVNPVWDGGDFCQPLLNLFADRKQSVIVLDTIHFIGKGDFAAEGEAGQIKNIASFIRNNMPKIDLVAGYALGGTLAMKLARYLPETKRILCMSGPGFIDKQIRKKLQCFIDLLADGDLAGCLTSLSKFVAPRGDPPNIKHLDQISRQDSAEGCRRMIEGFKFLLSLDARSDLENFMGKVMCMIGEHSQLATTDNLAVPILFSDSSRKVVQVPEAGMRILRDNEEYTLTSISEWLENDK